MIESVRTKRFECFCQHTPLFPVMLPILIFCISLQHLWHLFLQVHAASTNDVGRRLMDGNMHLFHILHLSDLAGEGRIHRKHSDSHFGSAAVNAILHLFIGKHAHPSVLLPIAVTSRFVQK